MRPAPTWQKRLATNNKVLIPFRARRNVPALGLRQRLKRARLRANVA